MHINGYLDHLSRQGPRTLTSLRGLCAKSPLSFIRARSLARRPTDSHRQIISGEERVKVINSVLLQHGKTRQISGHGRDCQGFSSLALQASLSCNSNMLTGREFTKHPFVGVGSVCCSNWKPRLFRGKQKHHGLRGKGPGGNWGLKGGNWRTPGRRQGLGMEASLFLACPRIN